MGHITTDLIEDAWKKLKTADTLIDDGQTYAGVMKCENALDDLYRSSDGVGEGVWFSEQEHDVRDDIFELKRTTEPNAEAVREVVAEVRDITKETKSHVVPIINERIDYETDARLS